ncbi:MAG: photosystem II protein, Psb35-related, partial [Dolichospermum sp.]
VIGSLAYFMCEQSKPIHESNWASDNFEALAKSITGLDTDYTQRTPAYAIDAYNSRNLPQ